MDQPSWYVYKFKEGDKVLDIGCGFKKFPNSIGLDICKTPQVDVVHNLDKFPYPFPNDSIDAIYLNHCIEHLVDPKRSLEECIRIAKPGCSIFIMAPHFTNAASFGDCTHRRYFSYRALPGLADASTAAGKKVLMQKMRVTARISPFTPFINLSPRLWEDYLCYIIIGRTLYYRFQVTSDAVA